MKILVFMIFTTGVLGHFTFAKASSKEAREAFEHEFWSQRIKYPLDQPTGIHFRGEFWNRYLREWEVDVISSTPKLNQLWHLQCQRQGDCIEIRGCTLLENVDRFQERLNDEDYWQYLRCSRKDSHKSDTDSRQQ